MTYSKDLKLNLNNPNPWLADSRNTMFIRKSKHNSKIVWLGSWLNRVGQPMGNHFSTLKQAKQKAKEMGIPFKVAQQSWVSV